MVVRLSAWRSGAMSSHEALRDALREQSADAVPGVHYQPYDKGAFAQRTADEKRQRHMNAVAPLTPRKPTATTPSRPPSSRSSHAATENPATPFEAQQRLFHSSQQAALNAELRGTCETHLDGWLAVVDRIKAAVYEGANQAPPVAAATVEALKAYEDSYACVHDIAPTNVMDDVAERLQLNLNEELIGVISDRPRLDREGLRVALADLAAPPGGDAGAVPASRQQLRWKQISVVDEVSLKPHADAALRLHRELHADVVQGAHEALSRCDAVLRDASQRAAAVHQRRQETIEAASSAASNAKAPVRQGTLLAQAAELERREVDARSEVVHERVLRAAVMENSGQEVEEHTASRAAAVRIAQELGDGFLDETQRRAAASVSDLEAVTRCRDEMADDMLAQQREFLRAQSAAHSRIMELTTREQSLWADVVSKATEAISLTQERDRLVRDRMIAAERESKRQRVAAEEIALVKTRVHRLGKCKRALEEHVEAAKLFADYVATMAAHVAGHDVQSVFDKLLQSEISAAVRDYGAFATVANDLETRLENRAEGLDRAMRQAQLDHELAVDCLDPDVAEYAAARDNLRAKADAAQRDVSQLRDIMRDCGIDMEPLLDLANRRGWIDKDVAAAVRSDQRDVRGAEVSESDDDDSAAVDPQVYASRKGLHHQLRVQRRAEDFNRAEQEATEAHITTIRAAKHENKSAAADHAAAQRCTTPQPQ